MEKEKQVDICTNNIIIDDDSLDVIIEQLQELNLYLKTDNNCKMLLKLSEEELQNEIKFKSRAKKIQKYHHKHDQKIFEESIINELQNIINNNNLNTEFGEESISELEPKAIAEIYDKIMILKMSNITNVNSLESSIKSNKLILKEITKIEKEINFAIDKLSPKSIPFKKSENKITQTNNSRDLKSSISLSSVSRRNDQDIISRFYPRTYVERVKKFGSTTNDDNIIIIEPQTHINETFRMRLETDHTGIMENFINRSNIDQITRCKNTEDWANHDLTLRNMDDDFGDYSILNSTVNLHKENEDNNSGDVLLILQPPNSWIDV